MASATVLDSMLLVARTGDDIAKWDPATWQVYGSNSSGEWSDANWTLLGSGNTHLGPQRGSVSVVSFSNATAYAHYKVAFPTTRGASDGWDNSNIHDYLQLSEARLFRGATVTLGGLPDLRTLVGTGWSQRMWFNLTGTEADMLAGLAAQGSAAGDVSRVQAGALETPYSQSDLNTAGSSVPVELRPTTSSFAYKNYGQIASGYLSTSEAATYRFWVGGDQRAELYLYDVTGTSFNVVHGVAAPIARTTGWTRRDDWRDERTLVSGQELVSSSYANVRSAAITLAANTLYR